MKIHRLLVAGALAFLVSPAAAAEGSWQEVGRTSIPLYYYQGMSHDPAGNRYFTGIWFGLYRTDPELNESARNDDVIPPEVHLREQYNHVGDLSYAGGNLYLPLECYYPPAGNTCKTGSIGVADPMTLEMEYYVKLDPAEITKAMWCEVSPDGALLWTQDGKDLLAYDMNAFTETNAAPGGPLVRPVRRLTGVVPPEGITGATFIDDRLFVAGQGDAGGVIYSIDLRDGSRTLETRTDYVGESEGLDDDLDLAPGADGLGGSLHYMVMPYNEEAYPTNGVTNGVIYHYEQAAAEPTSLTFTKGGADSGHYTDEAVFEARLVDSDGHTLGGQTLSFSFGGSSKAATTDGNGVARAAFALTQRPGTYEVSVSYAGIERTYGASSASAPFVLDQEDSTTSLSASGRRPHRSLNSRLSDADDTTSGVGGRSIDFYVDGSFMGSDVTDSYGTASLAVPPRYQGGHHTFEARFGGDDYFKGSSGTTRT
ncbi:MAG: hypothetical protein M3285_08815 [Actinomycetota bacterium]|nr:hypothetical protein [Actinomycetota bacterium]